MSPYRTNAKMIIKKAPSTIYKWFIGTLYMIAGAFVLYLVAMIPFWLGGLCFKHVFHFDYISFYNGDGREIITPWLAGVAIMIAIPLIYIIPKCIGAAHLEAKKDFEE